MFEKVVAFRNLYITIVLTEFSAVPKNVEKKYFSNPTRVVKSNNGQYLFFLTFFLLFINKLIYFGFVLLYASV